MTDVDQVRIHVIELEGRFLRLEERIGALTVEVIKGRTDVAEKQDAQGERIVALTRQQEKLAEASWNQGKQLSDLDQTVHSLKVQQVEMVGQLRTVGEVLLRLTAAVEQLGDKANP